MKRHWAKEFGPVYFITNTICDNKNIFIFKPYIQLILNSWKHFQDNRAIDFLGFVIMPFHLHYMSLPKDQNYSIVEMQRDFKKFTSKRILDGLKYELQNGMFPILDIFRKKNLTRESASDLLKLFEIIGKSNRQNYKVWMSDDQPVSITTTKFLKQKLDYIHKNPIEAKLVKNIEDYPFSSARNYYLDDDSLIKISKDFLL